MKISVVMPVYNTAIPILKEAVDGILAQTFRDFEFIIIDDGSCNEVKDYLKQLTDPRIRLIRNETNIGITKSLNIGFLAAQGKYIARMDNDDVSLPERLEKQLAFMESHPDAILCGDGNAQVKDMETYRIKLLFGNPGPLHPSIFIDREKLVQFHIAYDETLTYAQDYGLFADVSEYGGIYILSDKLVRKREHENQITKMHRERQIQCDKMTQKKLLLRLLDNVTDAELDMHHHHSTGFYHDVAINPQIVTWYNRLIAANKQKRIYDQKKLERMIDSIKKRLTYAALSDDMSTTEKAIMFFPLSAFILRAAGSDAYH